MKSLKYYEASLLKKVEDLDMDETFDASSSTEDEDLFLGSFILEKDNYRWDQCTCIGNILERSQFVNLMILAREILGEII